MFSTTSSSKAVFQNIMRQSLAIILVLSFVLIQADVAYAGIKLDFSWGGGSTYDDSASIITQTSGSGDSSKNQLKSVKASTLGDVFCNAAANAAPFINVFDFVAFVAGTYIAAAGVMMLAKNSEAPNQAPLPHCYARLVAGALLMCLPDMAGVVIQSLFGGISDANGVTSCTAGAVTAASTGSSAPGLDVMMTNLVTNIKGPLIAALSIVCFIVGVFLVLRGVLRMAKFGQDPKEASMPRILTSMVFGAIFMVMGQSLNIMMDSVFGVGTTLAPNTVLSWSSINSLGVDTTSFKTAVTAALTFFQLVGFIAFVRGWNVVRNAAEGSGQATYAQGFTHIIGGVMAINIYQYLIILDHTFGTSFVTG